MKYLLAALACSTLALASCGQSNDDADDAIEDAAEARAAAAGPAAVALGLSHAQLLEADLIDGNGVELGDVEDVLRNPAGEVDRLLVEIEDSNPDRFVEVPVEGLTTRQRGNDTDLVSQMTPAQLAALPDAAPRTQ